MRRAILITALGCALLAVGGCGSESSSNGAGNTGTSEPGVLPPPNNNQNNDSDGGDNTDSGSGGTGGGGGDGSGGAGD